jgi:myo-inositol 2-dehydrogenase / D-chiro-inositol 1-dehydrogenase
VNDQPFRIAVAGAGRMGRVHLDALARSDQVEVVAVLEPVEAIRLQIADRGLRTFATLAELLEDRAFDGVLIAAPTDRHVELVEAFALAGIPILCEKPVGMAATDAIAAAHAVERAAIVFQVGYWRRFVPALRALRERIASGELGEIVQISCLQWDAEPPSAQFRAHSGGIAVDMGVHEFDQARWLTGHELTSVTAVPGGAPVSVGPGDQTEADPDVAAITARLTGGAVLIVSLGRTFPEGDCCWVEVFGTEGYERVPFMWGTQGDEVFHAALAAQAEAFAAAVRGAEPVGAGVTDAVAALRSAELARDALRRESRARVPA